MKNKIKKTERKIKLKRITKMEEMFIGVQKAAGQNKC